MLFPENPNKLFNYISSLNFAYMMLLGEDSNIKDHLSRTCLKISDYYSSNLKLVF